MTDINEREDLTAQQKDYAIFLPALSNFYSNYIGKQRFENYVDISRMPTGIPEMEMMNYLNDKKGLFHYKWSLYSAGYSNLNLDKTVPFEDMIRNRDDNVELVLDSGGFQIGKGVWKGEWNNPNHKETEKRRQEVFKWLSKGATTNPNQSSYSMCLDIPAWSYKDPIAAKNIGIYSFQDAVNATQYNNEYFIKNKFGNAKFLNVLQGGDNHTESDHWYDIMKKYADPTKYENHFQGWGMAGVNTADLHIVLKRIVTLIHEGLLEKGVHDWMHFLGTSKLEWAIILTDIQRAVRLNYNENFTISFDAASAFLATTNGQIYTSILTPKNGKWSCQAAKAVDDKKYAQDTRTFRNAVMQDGIHSVFEESPISTHLKINDICRYGPGDLNKNGKEGKTSWDSFSYHLMMGHNVYLHIKAVQEANRQHDKGIMPKMLVNMFNGNTIQNEIFKIFEERDYKKQLQMIDDNYRFWMQVVGSRGMGGKKAINSGTAFANLVHNNEEFGIIQGKDKPVQAEIDNSTGLFKFN